MLRFVGKMMRDYAMTYESRRIRILHKSISATASQLRMIIDCFEQTGSSTHSPNAATLQYIIDYCELYKIPYRVTAHPSWGYFIEKYTSTPEEKV